VNVPTEPPFTNVPLAGIVFEPLVRREESVMFAEKFPLDEYVTVTMFVVPLEPGAMPVAVHADVLRDRLVYW
jgi:hypothetical protein